MELPDLFAMRQSYNSQRIMLCFNGPFSRSLIEEIGNALRNYLQGENAPPGSATDVFSVYIELAQNIRHYAAQHGYSDIESSATVVIGRDDDDHYVVCAGNLVEHDDGASLVARIQELAAMDKAALKAAYKEQLRRPRPEGAVTGAGLGLIDMARRAARPLACSLRDTGEGRAFISLQVVI